MPVPLPVFQPLPLDRSRSAFSHPDWLFEVKWDGFRALVYIDDGDCKLVSRNGNQFKSFAVLNASLLAELSVRSAVLDGEIVCLDRRGRPQFKDLLFRRGQPCYFAFDLLMLDGKDQCNERLIDRKQELRRLLTRVPTTSALKYVDHVDGSGTALFQRICRMDLEGGRVPAEIRGSG